MNVIRAMVLVLILAGAGQAQTTITLKTGGVVQGKILQETLGFVKIEAYGIPLTIYRDEIEEMSNTVTEVTVEQISPEGRQIISADADPEPVAAQEPPAEILPESPPEIPPPAGPPVVERTIETREIKVDGLASDWDGVPVIIEDTAGDVKKVDPEGAGEVYDVESIRLARGREDLFVQVVFTKKCDDLFKANLDTPQLIGTFFFDADHNTLTGGRESFTGQAGFESQMNLWARLVRDSGREASAQTHYFELVINVNDPADGFLDTAPSRKIDSLARPDLFTCRDRILEMQVPFEALALNAAQGTKVRVLFREEAGGVRADDEEAFSSPVIVSF